MHTEGGGASEQGEGLLRESEERFRLLVEGVKDYAIFMLDPEGHIVTWNRGAERIKGYRADEILGQHFSIFYTQEDIERDHPSAELRIAAAEGSYEEQGLRLRKDGSRFWANVVITALRNPEGDLRGFAKVTRDITERVEAAERERAEEELRRSAERYRSFVEQSTEGIWRFELEEPVSIDLPAEAQIELFYSHGYLAECNDTMAAMYGFSRAAEIVGARLGDFLPRSVTENVEYLEAFVRSGYRLTDAASEEVDREGRPRCFLNNLAGIVEDGRLVRAWGTQRDVTERHLAEEAQRFLAESSDLLASSLDYRATLSNVARLAVPTLADWCAVDVLGQDGALERLAVEHPDPERVALAYELQRRYPADPDSPRGVHQVLRTGEPEMMSEIPPELIEGAARDEEHREILRKLGLRSYMVVPLVARGRTLGAITFIAAESGRIYGEADLEFGRELARRAALAVDNARLFEEAQTEIAERRWAQEELRASRDQLEVILRGVTDGITAQDASGRLIYANEVAARIAGYPSVRAMIDTPPTERLDILELTDESGQPFPPERLPGRRALAGEEGAEEVLRYRVLTTGEERWTIAKAAPVFDERGEVRVAVSIFRDITESRRAEESMRRVREAERNRMARDLHDGPLQDLSYTAAAMGVMMLKAEGTELEGQLQEAIDAIRRAAQGLRDAVHDLRIEEQNDRPFPELVASLVRRNRSMARGYEIDLQVGEGFPQAPLGETGTQVWRILQEALTNARRHSRASRVSVVLEIEGEDLIASVSDDGRGFEPGTVPGVGQGSMRERAAAVGGELRIESEPARGTSVRLRIPLPKEVRG